MQIVAVSWAVCLDAFVTLLTLSVIMGTEYCHILSLVPAVSSLGTCVQGVISVTSNLIPGLFSTMMHQSDPKLNSSLQQLIAWLFCEPNPVGVNTAMAMCGLVKPLFRLPYVPLNREQREAGAVLLRQVQQHIPGCHDIQVLDDDDFAVLSKY